MTPAPSDPQAPDRILAFARFFKGYMGVAALVTAALPIPIAAWSAIPTFAKLQGQLATFASLLCFLLLAYLFYLRHSIASVLFVHRHARIRQARLVETLPLVLMVACVASIFCYQATLARAIDEVRSRELLFQSNQSQAAQHAAQRPSVPGKVAPAPLWDTAAGRARLATPFLLANTEQENVPQGQLLFALYLAIFVFAEGAFALMALREYLQDVLQLSDPEIIAKIAAPRVPLSTQASAPSATPN